MFVGAKGLSMMPAGAIFSLEMTLFALSQFSGCKPRPIFGVMMIEPLVSCSSGRYRHGDPYGV